MLYEFRKGSTTTEAHRNICQTEGENVLCYATVKNWYKKFASGQEDLADQPRSGRPTTVNHDALRQVVEETPTSSTRKLAADLDSNKSTIAEHLHKIGFVNKKGIEIPHALTPAQKEKRVTICSDLLARFEASMQLSLILTCDEKWIFLNNVTTQHQWLQPGETSIQTPKQRQHDPKVLLCVWWCSAGIVHFEVLPNNTIITANLYR